MYDEPKMSSAYGEARVTADPSDTSTRVHKAVAVLNETHEHLGHLVTKLSERLTPVLRPNDPRDAGAQVAEVRGPASALSVALAEQADHARAMADQVNDLIERLEI